MNVEAYNFNRQSKKISDTYNKFLFALMALLVSLQLVLRKESPRTAFNITLQIQDLVNCPNTF